MDQLQADNFRRQYLGLLDLEPEMDQANHSREEKNHINISFWSGFPPDIPDPYTRMPRGQKVSSRHWGHRKMYLLVRTSTIFGADVHDLGSRKTLSRKSLR